LRDQKLKIRNRQGGEFFKPHSKRPTKKIKQLLQESDLPPWERDSLPLVFIGDELASIPNFGVDIKYQGKPQETGLMIELTQSK
jgi:tRNA(Ile)-lysidine synthase